MRYLCLIGMLVMSGNSAAETTKYFGQLRYNHVSLHLPIKGISPMSAQEASTRDHYAFTYDDRGKLTQIINNSHSLTKTHPLTNIGSYKVLVEYIDHQETYRYFDVNHHPTANIRGVHKEVYQTDAAGFRRSLQFYDENNRPVESNWNIAHYHWHKQDDLVIERRFNLAGEAAPFSPYFKFGTTAIRYDDRGERIVHLNYGDGDKLINSDFGVAYYVDEYDELLQHVKFSYFDDKHRLTLNPWGWAYAVRHYDEEGYSTGITKYHLDHQPVD